MRANWPRRSLRRTAAAAAFWCTLLVCAAPAVAQRTASVSGLVYTLDADQVQSAWPGVRVGLRNLMAGVTHSTVTNHIGRYTFDGVAPGNWELTVSLDGYGTEQRLLELAAGDSLQIDIRLRPGGTLSVINVRTSGTAPAGAMAGNGSPDEPWAIDPAPQDARRAAALLEGELQQQMPLVPGIHRGPDGLLNMRGARTVQSGKYVNAASVEDPVNGQTAVSLPLEAVNPVRAIPNRYSAEHERETEGVYEIDSRAGNDGWRFGLRGFWPRLRYRNGVSGIRSITPGLSFSGPLVKGRLYLSQVVDYNYVQTQIESRPFLPEGQDETGLESFDSFTRLDWNVNATHRLTGSFALYPQNQTHVNLDTFNPQAVTPNYRQRGYFATVSERAIFPGSGYLDSSYTVKRVDAHVFPSTPGAVLINGLFLFPSQNFGAWYDTQDRNSITYQWRQDLHLRPLQAGGTHLIQAGYRYDHAQYDGRVANFPVTVLRLDGTASQRVDYLQPEDLAHKTNYFAAYVHDRWEAHPRFAIDAGLRISKEDAGGDTMNVAPRVALTIVPTPDHETVLRVGAGIYHATVPLSVHTFTDYPAQILTRFAADGIMPISGPTQFTNRVATRSGETRVPYTIVWSATLEREFGSAVQVRAGYRERWTRRDFVVEQVESLVPLLAEIQLRNSGEQRYREFLAELRWHAAERTTLYFSYVRSRASGDLNTFDQFFGNYPTPIIRPNERGRHPYDVPDRMLLWGTVGLPWKLELLPVLDVRSGFPFSALDDDLNYVGRRNRAGRYPLFFALDAELSRWFTFDLMGRQWNIRVGARLYNVTNHFNPRDVQDVTTHPQFGQFFNTADRQFRLRFDFHF